MAWGEVAARQRAEGGREVTAAGDWRGGHRTVPAGAPRPLGPARRCLPARPLPPAGPPGDPQRPSAGLGVPASLGGGQLRTRGRREELSRAGAGAPFRPSERRGASRPPTQGPRAGFRRSVGRKEACRRPVCGSRGSPPGRGCPQATVFVSAALACLNSNACRPELERRRSVPRAAWPGARPPVAGLPLRVLLF